MAYRKKLDFSNPSADELIENRSKAAWLFPVTMLLPSVKMFDVDADLSVRLLYVSLWIVMNVAACWWLLGLPFRWMSELERRKINDEWSRAINGDACKWALAAVTTLGSALMVAEVWLPLHTGKVIYALVNAAVMTGFLRMAWLSRGEPLGDE